MCDDKILNPHITRENRIPSILVILITNTAQIARIKTMRLHVMAAAFTSSCISRYNSIRKLPLATAARKMGRGKIFRTIFFM